MARADLKEPPSILFIIGHLGRGGAEGQLYNLLRNLERPATVLSLSRGGFWAEPIRALGCAVIELERGGHLDIRRLFATVRVIRRLKPDIVHLFLDQVGGLYGRLGMLLALRNDLIVGERSDPSRHPGWFRLFMPLLNRFVSHVICNSMAAREYIVAHSLAAEHKIHVIPNGLDLEDSSPTGAHRSDPPWPKNWSDAPLIGLVGHLSADKDPETFVRASAQVHRARPDARFVIVGDGPLRSRVRERIRACNLERVLLLAGERPDVPHLLGHMQLLISTSICEGMPNAIIEAMGAGLPCVATDVGGCREVIEDGVTGFLVPPGDIHGLKDRILRILSDDQLRTDLAQAARARAKTHFDSRSVASRYRGIYEGLRRSG